MKLDRQKLAQVMYVAHLPTASDKAYDLSKCHICLEPGPLTKEHVPPRSAFNDCPKVWDKLITQSKPYASVQYQKFQKGNWVKTLCGHCNNVICNTYAKEYASFVKFLVEKPHIYDPNGEARWLVVEQDILFLAKQIAAMILAIEPLTFAEGHGELRNFVLDESATLDPQLMILAFIVPERKEAGTIARFHSRLDTYAPGYGLAGGEISMYPFGIVYASDMGQGYEPDKFTNIIDWFKTGDQDQRKGRPFCFYTKLTGIDSMTAAFGGPRMHPQIDYLYSED